MDKANIGTPQILENPELLTRSEVAQLLHVSLSYIDHLTDLPSYKLGKKKLFNKREVIEYLSMNRSIPFHKAISKTEKIETSKEVADE